MEQQAGKLEQQPIVISLASGFQAEVEDAGLFDEAMDGQNTSTIFFKKSSSETERFLVVYTNGHCVAMDVPCKVTLRKDGLVLEVPEFNGTKDYFFPSK